MTNPSTRYSWTCLYKVPLPTLTLPPPHVSTAMPTGARMHGHTLRGFLGDAGSHGGMGPSLAGGTIPHTVTRV